MFFTLSVLAACSLSIPTTDVGGSPAASVSSVDPRTTALTSLSGDPLSSEVLDGKATLFVNVASRCGLTGQYDGLQALYEEYKDQGLVIVGVPCNQFGNQEPGSAEEIQSFCRMNYGVEFPLLEKQDVNGQNRSELYTALIDSAAGGGKSIKWNFEKFLVAKDGSVLQRFGSTTKPSDPKLRSAIEAAL